MGWIIPSLSKSTNFLSHRVWAIWQATPVNLSIIYIIQRLWYYLKLQKYYSNQFGELAAPESWLKYTTAIKLQSSIHVTSFSNISYYILNEVSVTYPWHILCQKIYLSVSTSVTNFDPNYLRTGCTEWAKKDSVFRLKSIFPIKITTQTCTIRRGVWNLPHKFHLYFILVWKS